MIIKRLGLAGLVLAAGLATSACVDDYGYGGVNVGYGAVGAYGDPYYDGGFGDAYYGGDYGSSYFGWYGDYYYPGTGIYVYDHYRRPFRWNDGQRRYWEGRRNGWRGERNFRNDWNSFDRDRGVGTLGYRGNRGGSSDGARQAQRNGTVQTQGDYRGRGYRNRSNSTTQQSQTAPIATRNAGDGFRGGGRDGNHGRGGSRRGNR